MGDLESHFTLLPYEKRYKEAHVAKVLRCNWKVAQEAFMEAYHVVATHPQILAGICDANSKYDVFGNYARAITPNGVPSPHLSNVVQEEPLPDTSPFKMRHPLTNAIYDTQPDSTVLVTAPDGRSGLFTEGGTLDQRRPRRGRPAHVPVARGQAARDGRPVLGEPSRERRQRGQRRQRAGRSEAESAAEELDKRMEQMTAARPRTAPPCARSARPPCARACAPCSAT